MRIDVSVSSKVPASSRVLQIGGMFDVPVTEVSGASWSFDFPFEAEPWAVGLVVGPSGSGKSTVARAAFGDPLEFTWGTGPVVDDMPEAPLADIAAACQAVGFNTIPAWFRPHAVLSNGERFRAEMARALLTPRDVVVVDEFTSLVDRQVGRICAHAVQKAVRRRGSRFVAVTCHADVEDWLQPDWVLEMPEGRFRRRSVRRRPELAVAVERVDRVREWPRFAPFHYLTSDLHVTARCFGLHVAGEPRPVAFAGVMFRPSSRKNQGAVYGVSRLVTLPDWQGLGLALALADAVGGIYAAIGAALHTYPAHPALIRAFDNSPRWLLVKRPGAVNGTRSATAPTAGQGRPCATFRFVGEACGDASLAAALTA